MLTVGSFDTLIREQPLKIACTRFVESESDRRVDNSTDAIDPHGRVHAQCYIEAAVRKRFVQFTIRKPTFGFVENDKLDARNVRHQAGFGFADDPGEIRFRPRILNSPNDRECVTSVSDMGQPDDTNVFWWQFIASDNFSTWH